MVIRNKARKNMDKSRTINPSEDLEAIAEMFKIAFIDITISHENIKDALRKQGEYELLTRMKNGELVTVIEETLDKNAFLCTHQQSEKSIILTDYCIVAGYEQVKIYCHKDEMPN